MASRMDAAGRRSTWALVLFGVAASLCLPSLVLAGKPKTIRTGALVPNGTTFCTLANLGTEAIEVTFVMRNNQGAVVATDKKPVAPGQSEQINANIAFDLTRCEFSFAGSPKKVRAAIQLPDGSTSEAR
jgi:hypothetical protein